MYNKTSGPYFLKYGTIIKNPNDYATNPDYDTDYLQASLKTMQDVYRYDDEIILKCVKGIATLVVCEDIEDDILHQFVMHRYIALKPHMFFNIIPMTDEVIIQLYFKRGTQVYQHRLLQPYHLNNICASFKIDEIYSYYYSAKSHGYHFDGEKHDFYELTYVDNGSLHVTVDNKPYDINEYEIMIYGSNQFHTQSVLTQKPVTYLTVMFQCDIADPSILLNRVFKVQRDMQKTLNVFVNESSIALPYHNDLMVALFKLLIVQMLQYDEIESLSKPTSPIHQYFENELLNEILIYIQNNLYEPLTIDDICDHFAISRSSLQNLFKSNMNIAPKQYINEEKLKKSCSLIRENKYNISEIALMLGFNSIHYFSRKFTQRYKLTPTEYAKSVYKG